MRPVTNAMNSLAPRRWMAAVALCAMTFPVSAAGGDSFRLIDRDLVTRSARAIVIDERRLTYADPDGVQYEIDLDRCIALVRPEVPRPPETDGMLILADGQRLPGTLAPTTAISDDELAWSHPWLAPTNVPMNLVAAVTLTPHQPVPTPERADVVVLRNSDRLEGFITALADPIMIEVTTEAGTQEIEVPIERVAALALVTARRPPAGRRIWFEDATVLDVRDLRVGDDGYVRFRSSLVGGSAGRIQTRLSDVSAILLDGEAMRPLSAIPPARIEANTPRYELPQPRLLDERAAFGLHRIEYRGPIIVRYALPAEARRFAAEASLPDAARAWGDCELVIRDDDREVFRARINRESPTATINVELTGSELTIEIEAGEHGPIQDRIVLNHPMLLMK
jgi:hypothetical protein